MWPVLIDFGEVTLGPLSFHLRVASFGFFTVLAILLGWLVVRRLGPRTAPAVPWLDLYLGILFFGLLGSKLFYALIRLPDLVAGTLTAFEVLRSGGVFLGGVVGGSAFAWVFFRRHDLGVGTGLNVLFTALPLAHAAGRIGCLLAGCCFGKACSLPWAVTYTSPLAGLYSGVPLGIPLHPSPFYETAVELLNLNILYRLWGGGVPRPWTIPAVWCGLYGTQRFVLEIFRGDPRGEWVGLSTSQWLSLGMVAVAVAWLFLHRRVAEGVPSGPEDAAELELGASTP